MQPCFDTVAVAAFFDQNLTQFLRDVNGVKRAPCREQLFPVHGPCAAAFVPAVDAATLAIIKNGFFDLYFDQFALFFDHDDQVQAVSPVVKPFHIQRECLADFVCGDAQPFGLGSINVQQGHSVDKVEPVFTCRHEADFGPRLAPHPVVHLVSVAESFGGEAFVVDHPCFLFCWRVDEPDV